MADVTMRESQRGMTVVEREREGFNSEESGKD